MVAVGFCLDVKKHRVWFLTRSKHLGLVETGLHFESHLYSRITPCLWRVTSPQASISFNSDCFYFQSRVHAKPFCLFSLYWWHTVAIEAMTSVARCWTVTVSYMLQQAICKFAYLRNSMTILVAPDLRNRFSLVPIVKTISHSTKASSIMTGADLTGCLQSLMKVQVDVSKP